MSVRIPAFRFLLFLIALFASTNVFALEVSPNSVEIYAGDTIKLTVSQSSGTVTAVSSNATVVSVSYSRGTITVKGIKAGSAIITVKDKSSSKKVEVTVKSRPQLTVNPSFVVMDFGSTSSITVSNASGSVTVVSSKVSVATARYAEGKITVKGVAPGSSTLTIKDTKSTVTVSVTVKSNTPLTPPTAAGNYTLLAWNDLGMHCMDGMDFSVFTILPPYNTLHAQLKDKSGKLISTNVKLTYEAVADSAGSINSYSDPKTNFWDWAGPLFGVHLAPEVGINLDGLLTGPPAPGNRTPSWVPAGSISHDMMTYNENYRWFEAEGIPMTPFPDGPAKDASGHINKNFYPTVKVVARDLNDKLLAEITTVLPVSDEMTCKGCHASTSSTSNKARIAAKPAATATRANGWVFDPNLDKDWKRNILLLHDQKQLSKQLYKDALRDSGYSPLGLLATADSAKPVLCVKCHASNAYFDKLNKKTVMPGLPGIRAFTEVLHSKHARVGDPSSTTTPQATLDGAGGRSACYNCHPGSVTQCLRGAMSTIKDTAGNPSISCQSCHGNMEAVGSPNRQGWFNEPTCESCHNSEVSNKRAISVFDANGVAFVPKTDHTFATNADTPVTGLNLYRFSTGHGGLQCEACHGSTHAEYPSTHVDENTQSVAVQGHAGTVAECKACHTIVPATVNGGPHGMHTTGDAWIEMHKGANKNVTGSRPSCAYCHGITSAGTQLSAIKVAKTINAGEFGIKNWPAGYQVSCFSCHNGPNPD